MKFIRSITGSYEWPTDASHYEFQGMIGKVRH